VPLFAEKTEIIYYVTFDELFNVIHEAQIAIGHGGRTGIIKELNSYPFFGCRGDECSAFL
jgi:hypothetical protein